MMEKDKMNLTENEDLEVKDTQKTEGQNGPVSETWAQDVIEDLDDFIESQGIYLRQ
ncbi:MAG: hypothetical protein Q4B59_02355 [Lachnospiraceae bacterium]|nr:hypothetical protein [Lachnospiraceae bacterium]